MNGTRIRGLFSDAPQTDLPEATEAESGLRRLPAVELEEDLFGDLPTLVFEPPANDIGDLGLADVLEPVKPPPVPEIARRSSPMSLHQLVRRSRPPEPSMIDLDAVMRTKLPPPTVTVDAPPAGYGIGPDLVAKLAVIALFALGGFAAAHLATAAGDERIPEPAASEPAPASPIAPAVSAPPAASTEADTASPEPELARVTLPDVVVHVPRATAPAKARPTARRAAAPAAQPARAAAAGSLPETPTREQVIAALRPFEGRVRACADGYFGVATVRIVAQPSGRVTTATVTGGSVVGTPAGSCIARTLRAARFPAFGADRFVVQYPFQL